MADRQSIRVRETLKSLFSDQRLNALAKATGFVKSQRKVKPVAFFWTLVLGFEIGSARKISGLRRGVLYCARPSMRHFDVFCAV
jgi:hypothetical protein